MVEIDTAVAFKSKAKDLIKQCKFKEAAEFASSKFESDIFADLPLRENVTLVHWWTKVFLYAGDMKSLTQRCLTKVNTLLNAIMTTSRNGFEPLNALQTTECLAELLYLKRAIDSQIQFHNTTKVLDLFEEEVLSQDGSKDNLLITKYYVKTLQLYDEYQLGIDAKIGFDHLLKAE